MTKSRKAPKCQMVYDGTDLFVVFDGVRIAKRGHPGTPQARTWVSIDPGFVVTGTHEYIDVEKVLARAH